MGQLVTYLTAAIAILEDLIHQQSLTNLISTEASTSRLHRQEEKVAVGEQQYIRSFVSSTLVVLCKDSMPLSRPSFLLQKDMTVVGVLCVFDLRGPDERGS